MEIRVQRSAEGSLGVIVDQDNTIVTVTAQPELQVGDVVVGVDGERLGARAVRQLLKPGAEEYTFMISRPTPGKASAAESLEGALKTLLRDVDNMRRNDRKALFEGRVHGLMHLEEGSEAAGRAASLLSSLEEAAVAGSLVPSTEAEVSAALSSGFWKLILATDGGIAEAGLTGYGTAPYCTVVASFQAFLPTSPSAQTVEVVVNSNVQKSTVAALKGDWQGADAGTDDARAWGGLMGGLSASVCETYDRLEFDGSPIIPSPMLVNKWSCTYLSAGLRVIRTASTDSDSGSDGHGDAWRVYERLDPGVAQEEIAKLLAAPVPRSRGDSLDDMPDWARQRGQSGGLGGYGGYGPGTSPLPEADGLR